MRDSKDVLEFVKNNKIDFVRLAFVPVDGSFKTISVPTTLSTRALKQYLEEGHPIDGYPVDSRMLDGKKSFLIMPDPTVIKNTQFYNHGYNTALMMSDILNRDGSQSEVCPRTKLKQLQQRHGLRSQVSLEIEYYLRNKDGSFQMETNWDHYDEDLDCPKVISRENTCLDLAKMGIHVSKAHKEAGPGQQEIVLDIANAVGAADDFMFATRKVIPNLAKRHGFIADLSAKPAPDVFGSGAHVHFSFLDKDNNNLFAEDGKVSAAGLAFANGIAEHEAILQSLYPTDNSYARLDGSLFVPSSDEKISDAKNALVKLIHSGVNSRTEYRAFDNAVNMHIALTTLFSAGLMGLRGEFPLGDKFKHPVMSLAQANHTLKNLLESGKVRELGLSPDIVEMMIANNEMKLENNGELGKC